MILDPRCLRLIEPPRRPRGRDVALVLASAVVDGVAVSALLLVSEAPSLTAGLATLALHAAAALLLMGVTDMHLSRRRLGLTALLVVPFAGVAVAAAAGFTRGCGPEEMRRRRAGRPARPSPAAAIRRLGRALPLGDALVCGDVERRRAALLGLSQRGDSEAIALLRWAASAPDPDLALVAALALDEIGERAEREVLRPELGRLRHGAR
jgi:hypothetical protein